MTSNRLITEEDYRFEIANVEEAIAHETSPKDRRNLSRRCARLRKELSSALRLIRKRHKIVSKSLKKGCREGKSESFNNFNNR